MITLTISIYTIKNLYHYPHPLQVSSFSTSTICALLYKQKNRVNVLSPSPRKNIASAPNTMILSSLEIDNFLQRPHQPSQFIPLRTCNIKQNEITLLILSRNYASSPYTIVSLPLQKKNVLHFPHQPFVRSPPKSYTNKNRVNVLSASHPKNVLQPHTIICLRSPQYKHRLFVTCRCFLSSENGP